MTEPIHEVPSTPDNDWDWGAVRFGGSSNRSTAGSEPSARGFHARAHVVEEPRLNAAPAPPCVTTEIVDELVAPATTPTLASTREPAAVAPPTPPSAAATTSENVGIAAVLEEAVARKASDVHINAGSPPMLRIDGELAPSSTVTAYWAASIIDQELLPLLSTKRKAAFNTSNELDFTFTSESGARFRTNYFRQQGNVGAAFRHVPDQIRSLRELGISESIARLAHLPRGLVLVTGPTGSGKSTTLASLIDLVNETRAGHIVTVEDPIEFIHPRKRCIVDQREVGHDTDSFAVALRQVLRQDPDVILVGEMRDLETISVALTAAETGHLVFATLHTQTASTTIDRILDVFPAHQQAQVRAQLSNSLQAVVSQTLLRRADGGGRAAATEVLITTAAVSNLIREGKTFQIPTAIQSGGAIGMHTLDQSLAALVNDGVVSVTEAEAKVIDQESFSRLLKPGAAHEVGRRTHGFER